MPRIRLLNGKLATFLFQGQGHENEINTFYRSFPTGITSKGTNRCGSRWQYYYPHFAMQERQKSLKDFDYQTLTSELRFHQPL